MAAYWDSSRTDSSYTISGTNSEIVTTGTAVTNAAAISAYTVTSGKRYFEIVVGTETTEDIFMGIAAPAFISNIRPGFDDLGEGDGYSWGFLNDSGNLEAWHGGAATDTRTGEIVNGDVVGLAVDIDNGHVWISINNVWLYSGDPVAGTTPVFNGDSTISADGVAPAVAPNEVGNGCTLRLLSSELDNIPSGFDAWEVEVTDVTIAAGLALSTTVAIGPILLNATLGLGTSVSVESTYYSNASITAGLQLSSSVVGRLASLGSITSGLQLSNVVNADIGAVGYCRSRLTLGSVITLNTADNITVDSTLNLSNTVTLNSKYDTTVVAGLELGIKVTIAGDCDKSLPAFINGRQWC